MPLLALTMFGYMIRYFLIGDASLMTLCVQNHVGILLYLNTSEGKYHCSGQGQR